MLGSSVSQAWRSGSTIPLYAATCIGYTRGDFVVFVPVTSTTRSIKKVAALPGDVVSFDETGAMFVNGEPILQGPDRRPYHPTNRTAAARFTGIVPRHDVIMISDADRAHSEVTEQDFSVFGLVNVKSIEFVAAVSEQQQAAMDK